MVRYGIAECFGDIRSKIRIKILELWLSKNVAIMEWMHRLNSMSNSKSLNKKITIPISSELDNQKPS